MISGDGYSVFVSDRNVMDERLRPVSSVAPRAQATAARPRAAAARQTTRARHRSATLATTDARGARRRPATTATVAAEAARAASARPAISLVRTLSDALRMQHARRLHSES